MQTFRTLLEQKIKERRLTLMEFVEFAETFAREHKESGTLSLRHLQRLIAGHGPKGEPLGQLRPATVRLLENIFKLNIDELLAPPTEPTPAEHSVEVAQRRHVPHRPNTIIDVQVPELSVNLAEQAGANRTDVTAFFDWLDERAGWIPDTAQRKVMARLAKLNTQTVVDQHTRRAKVSRSQVADSLLEYYGDCALESAYIAYCGEQQVTTSIATRPDWLDLACPLTHSNDRMTFINTSPHNLMSFDDLSARHAVYRLATSVALNVRVSDMPLYRLLNIEAKPGAIRGTVSLVPFAEYALTMDLLEGELTDAIVTNSIARSGSLSLRDRYLRNLEAVFDISSRLCAGGVPALCAIARPSDPYRGAADYALLVQQRSSNVLNAAQKLAVIPKGFHEPLTDFRGDAQIGSTLLREMEEELFGRSDVDSTVGKRRAAAPMHPDRLSEPMRWLMEDPGRLRMECTGFGLNLVSGNYEFASLIVIEDEEFWTRYGGLVEANWESTGLRLYSSLDYELLSELVQDEAWSNEGLFAFLQGLRRLSEGGDPRVDLPNVKL